ncbi:FAD dependent oxidoreductase [Nitzschia inconspicua]|uniref:FAD dependent oxidoreductase n=1 Tax=Nitzschia inconspicua TaxID=303405 RepID=A0A9K3KNS5_9STRA|nr:FAD dependent oxidoreductase [Nitzschia inconspicua]
MIDASSVIQTSASVSHVYDLLVIGGGVVGLACLRTATLQGWKCALVEAQPDLLSQASGSNSGIVCTGVDAAPGSLERALIRDSVSQFRIYCQEHNIPTRPCGSLVCQWEWNTKIDFSNNDVPISSSFLQDVLEESHNAGDTHATIMSRDEILTEEPNLSQQIIGAVHIPGEIVVDPWLYSVSLAIHAMENGADIYTNYPVDLDSLGFENGVWTLRRQTRDKSKNHHEWRLQAKAVVNAAGVWSDTVQTAAMPTTESPWTSKPRRGQYRIYESRPSTRITHPIQPIPTPRTKGIFVFSTIYNQLVVGPTAEDQCSRTDRTIDQTVAKNLDDYIQRIIPSIQPEHDLVGEYVGIRPGTNQRDYQIHVSPDKHWIAVAGIRSTGLTASLGIGNYVMRQLPSFLGPAPQAPTNIHTTPLPNLKQLVRDFDTLNGFVILNGVKFRVTHPLSVHGLKSLAERTHKD